LSSRISEAPLRSLSILFKPDFDLPSGIHLIDLTFGLALVAISEELLCRRCGKLVLRSYLADDRLMILVSALLFGLMHWSQGIAAMPSIIVLGAFMMRVHLEVGALWPLMVAHYIIDVIVFY
jgi:membrane protease YdiL (CAAX protease family)